LISADSPMIPGKYRFRVVKSIGETGRNRR
jgi:hypothetical protein